MWLLLVDVDGPLVVRCLFADVLTGILPAAPARRPTRGPGWHLEVVGTKRHVSQVAVVWALITVGAGSQLFARSAPLLATWCEWGSDAGPWTPCPTWPASADRPGVLA